MHAGESRVIFANQMERKSRVARITRISRRWVVEKGRDHGIDLRKVC